MNIMIIVWVFNYLTDSCICLQFTYLQAFKHVNKRCQIGGFYAAIKQSSKHTLRQQILHCDGYFVIASVWRAFVHDRKFDLHPKRQESFGIIENK